jgi:hypothetical protein
MGKRFILEQFGHNWLETICNDFHGFPAELLFLDMEGTLIEVFEDYSTYCIFAVGW